jgi:hypothetical protein
LNLSFRKASLQALCNSEAALRQRWGLEPARAVAQRLQELDAVDCLGDLRQLPHVGIAADERSGEITLRIEVGLDLCLVLSVDSTCNAWEEATDAVIVRINDRRRDPQRDRKGQ